MGNSNTPHSRALRKKTVAAWKEEKRGEGWAEVRAWLPPWAVQQLDALAQQLGGRGKAIECLLEEAIAREK